jgi:CHAT domain-containing protein/Tfp pilus assembly protein PilF
MLKNTCGYFLLLLAVFSIAPVVAGQQKLAPAGTSTSADEILVRQLIQRYFDLYEKKDIEGLTGLFSSQSPILSGRRELWTRLFPVENYKFAQPAIARVRVAGNEAICRVSTVRTVSLTNGETQRITDLRAEYTFRRENSDWRLWNETPAGFGLMNELVDAKNDAEREVLLAEDPLMVTREFLMQLVRNGDYAYVSGNYPRALNLLLGAKLVATRLDEKPELANIWTNLGIIHLLQNQAEQALNAYRRSLALYQDLGKKSDVGRMTANLGLVFSAMGKTKEALDHFDRGLKIAEELGEKAQIAQIYENIGGLYYEQNRYPLASEYYQKSAASFETAGLKSASAGRLVRVAKVEYEQGNDAAAVDFYHRAVAKYEEAGERRSRGYVFHSIANLYYTQGDYPQALSYYLKSVKAEEEVGNVQAKAGALQGIGLVHAINGQRELSLDAFEKNLAIIRTLNNDADTAAAFSKVGNSYFNLGQNEKALEAFTSALELRERTKDTQEIATALLDVGIIYAAQSEYEKALERYERSKSLFESAANYSGVGSALLNTSLVYFTKQNYEKSIEFAGQAAVAAKRADDTDLLWQARHRAGRAFYRLKDYPAARLALTEAIATIETTKPQSGKVPRYYENRSAPYRAMIDVSIAEGDGNDAFNYSERAKAQTLSAILRNGRLWIDKTMTRVEREQEQGYFRQVNTLSTQLVRELEKQKPNQARVGELKRAVEKAQTGYDAFLNRLYVRRPQLKVLRGRGKPLTVLEAVNIASDARTAYLAFAETDEQFYLFSFTKPEKSTTGAAARKPAYPMRVFVLGVPPAEMLARSVALNEAIVARAPVEAHLRDLYDLLIATAAPALVGKQRWIIIPDGALWGLPFEAFQTPDQHYLIETNAISLAPSLTTASLLSKTRTTIRPPRKGTAAAAAMNLLAYGNPTLNAPTQERMQAMLPQLADANATDPEADSQWDGLAAALAGVYPERQRSIHSGAEATKTRFREEAGHYRLLHLATRAVLNEAAPLFSGLALGSTLPETENGVLDFREIVGLDLKSDLIVLPATEPALPREGVGRSLTGLSWAFFVAGCPSALVSQRRVDAKANADLMLEFHKGYRSIGRKAEAWQSAVKQLLTREDTRHPYFWTGYSMMGGLH